MSPGKLLCGGTCNPIVVDIFTMGHEEYRICIFGRGEASLPKQYLPFLRKIKISHNPHNNPKYNAGQEIWTGPPGSCDFRGRKISNFSMHKHESDLIHDGRGRFFHRQSPSDAQGRKTWLKKSTGWRQSRQTQGTSQWPQSTLPPSNYKRQKQSFLTERTGYYGNLYSISGYTILWSFVHTLWCYPP